MATNDAKAATTHLEDTDGDLKGGTGVHIAGADTDAGLAVVDQLEVIPTSGERIPVSKWEYYTFILFYFQNNGSPIGNTGGSLRMKLISDQFPDGIINWGGQQMAMNAFLLDTNGILFAVNLFLMLVIGPYADYGTWRPYILMTSTFICFASTFCLIATYKPSQWQAVNALWMIGNLAFNVMTTFYTANWPWIGRNVPRMLKAEQDVKQGIITSKEFEEIDQLERSKILYLSNMVGSGLVVLFYGVATGVAYAVTHNRIDDDRLTIKAYQVLLAYLGVVVVLCTVPYFFFQKFRPGQAVPANTPLWKLGPKQLWSAMKCLPYLKNAMLYLIGYCIMQEAFGAAGGMTGILQAEKIHYNPVQSSAWGLLADMCGGTGCTMLFLIHRKYPINIKKGCVFGACIVMMTVIWGAIGSLTNKVGYHHVWEFYLAQCWNLFTPAWGAYSTTMITEVVPAPKQYLFYALFGTFSRVSGFTGPFICSAIINRTKSATHPQGNTNMAYWFPVGLGALGILFISLVDTKQAKIDNAKYLEKEAQELYSAEQRAAQAERIEKEEAAAAVSTVNEKA